ncbi:MAG: PEP-CTERM sorting domain-containing protein [Phycisphaerales bacterium]
MRQSILGMCASVAAFCAAGLAAADVQADAARAASFIGVPQINVSVPFVGARASSDSADVTTFQNKRFGVHTVPAPGAVALLGLAGLAGGRRRRA